MRKITKVKIAEFNVAIFCKSFVKSCPLNRESKTKKIFITQMFKRTSFRETFFLSDLSGWLE
ncbi:hypothetical protein FM107_05210 [Sphingobacterium sp. JB170]|nr:hypothetical protein FM107_05210 [Sphingobacterium sp. JB170]